MIRPLVVTYCCCALFDIASSSGATNGLDVYIVGGTGDLAKRYLWSGFFTLFRQNLEKEMHFYGTGRSEEQVFNGELSYFQNILLESIHCTNLENCQRDLQDFIAKTSYMQLKMESQFEQLCFSINSASNDVIFYLSIPPSAYEKIVKSLTSHCDVKHNRRRYKFVFEKPFGENLESAQSLSSLLNNYLHESQIFRVDHYLGKQTAHQILDFRKENPGIDEILNKKFVKEIEITATETIGCKGRTTYYDKSGVIRDMLQSHLTEILCLVTMDVSGDGNKMNLLKNISTVDGNDVSLGQYEGYSEEVAHETGIKKSITPTFAAAKLKIMSPRWSGVPVHLISGKQLKERAGYGRIVFKKKHFQRTTGCGSNEPQIVFVIRHNQLKSPAILVSRELPFNSRYIPQDWTVATHLDDLRIFGSKGKCFRILIPKNQLNAYSYLISKIYEGDHTQFVPVDELLESWRIWSPVIMESYNTSYIAQYNIGSSVSGIIHHERCEAQKCYLLNKLLQRCDTRPSHITFLGHPALILPTPFLIKTLADDINTAAAEKSDSDFHLALSGGNSPLKLYEHLRQEESHNFHWKNIHIWQVDERCSHDEYSNFANLKSRLLDFLPEIDAAKIHPMPNLVEGEPCPDIAVKKYEDELLNFTSSVNGAKLDYVLLGVGSDGHTASLFPGISHMLDTERYVIAGDIAGLEAPKRMSLTYRTLGQSDMVSILVIGKQKCEILKVLMSNKQCDCKTSGILDVATKYPICGVLSVRKRLKWYIDVDAVECLYT